MATDSMTTLQNRWYNSLANSLMLNSSTFQISQPCVPIPPTDEGLWGYANVLPPASLTFNRKLFTDPFFDAYAAVIGQLARPVNGLEETIGSKDYKDWTAYLATQHSQPQPSALSRIFKTWADNKFLSTANQGASALMAYILAVAAHEAIEPYRGRSAKVPDFNITYGDLLRIIGSSPAGNVSISRETSANLEGTWTRGVNSGVEGLWPGCDPDRRLSRLFATSKLSVDATFQHFAVVVVPPGKWYQSSLLGNAFANTSGNPPAWVRNADPAWNEAFGTDGFLQRLLISLVVVDGVTTTVTSDAAYSDLEEQTISEYAETGLWPLYAGTGGAVTNTLTFGNGRGMTIKTAIRAGNPVVLGGNVLSIASYLGR